MIAAHDARPLRRLAVAYLCFSVAFALAASIVGLRDHLDLLFADDWRVLDRYQSQSLLPFLLGPENGHRLPVTLALFAIDHEWFGGRMRTLVLASIACTALATGILWRVFWRQDRLDSALSISVLGFACFSFFWAASCHEPAWGLCQMICPASAI